MGLAYDANEVVQIPNAKHEMLEEARRIVKEDESLSDHEAEDATPAKNYVAEKLEAEAKAPRERLFKLPKGQAQFFTYLIKRYGEDYKVRYSLEKSLLLIISNYFYIYSLYRQCQEIRRTIIN